MVPTPATKQEADKTSKSFHATHGNSVMSTQQLEVSRVGAGTELRFERDTRSVV